MIGQKIVEYDPYCAYCPDKDFFYSTEQLKQWKTKTSFERESFFSFLLEVSQQLKFQLEQKTGM